MLTCSLPRYGMTLVIASFIRIPNENELETMNTQETKNSRRVFCFNTFSTIGT